MADAAGLANHQVGGGKVGVQHRGVVLHPTIVVRKAATHALHHIAVVGNVAAAPPHTQHHFLVQLHHHGLHILQRTGLGPHSHPLQPRTLGSHAFCQGQPAP